jgi:hypothetical protein
MFAVLPVLRRMNRRRRWQQHAVFLFGASNVLWVWSTPTLPLALLGWKPFFWAGVALAFAVYGSLFWKFYPGRSTARTALAFAAFMALDLGAGILLSSLASVACLLSLLWF